MLRATFYVAVFVVTTAATSWAQPGCQLVPQTILEPKAVTSYRWEVQDEMETRQVTVSKPVITTETRHRTLVTYKPVVRQRILEETYEVQRPVIETSEREQTVNETVYETTTEMQTQQVVVEKPVLETEYRDEQVIVRKPVTQTLLQTENVTAYRPVTAAQTVLVPSTVAVNQAVSDPLFQNRLQWLRPGYYIDPVTGFAQWQRPGLHWIPNPPMTQTVLQTSLVPQQQLQTTMVPEVVQQQRPVQVTAYQDVVETRRVPYQVQRTVRVTEERQVPVEVRKPVIRTRVEKVPITNTRYETRTEVRRTPIQETTYERVETLEPYEVQVQKWVNETSSLQVPKQVLKRVEYQTTQFVPRTVWHRVPTDAWGNLVYQVEPTVVAQSLQASLPANSNLVQNQSTTVAKPAAVNTEVVGQWQTVRKPSSLTGGSEEKVVLKKSQIIDDPSAPNLPETNSEKTNSVLEPIKDPVQPGAADQAPSLENRPGESDQPSGG